MAHGPSHGTHRSKGFPGWRVAFLTGLALVTVPWTGSAHIEWSSPPERVPALLQARVNDSFPAVLMPAQTALIRARETLQVAAVEVGVGSRVSAGDLLIRFADAVERVQVRRAEAFLEQAQAEFDRISALHDQGLTNDETFEETRIALELAESNLELQRILLLELSITSRTDGIIAERYVDPGASVGPGDSLVRVTALTPLRVEVVLPEEMLAELRRSTEAVVEVPSANRTLRLPVKLGPVVVDPASGTFLLQIEVPNDDERLTPGVSCRISFSASR